MSAETNFLVLGLDGTLISTGGDLQGDGRFISLCFVTFDAGFYLGILCITCARCAATIFQLVKTAGQGDLKAQRITVNYADHAYVICSSDKKIHVLKKAIALPEIVA